MAVLGAESAQLGPNCEHSCGNFSIMFPFGSGPGCYYDEDFFVSCNRSSGEPQPIFGDTTSGFAISNMSISKSELEIMMTVASNCYNSSGHVESVVTGGITWNNIRISAKNKFVGIGCDTQAYFEVTRENETISDGTGCISLCDRNSCISNGSCSGVGCCQVAVPNEMTSFGITVLSYNNHSNITDFNACGYGFLVKEGRYNFSTTDLLDFEKTMPILLDWAIGNQTCNTASQDTGSFLCKGKSTCDQAYEGPGYRCRCSDGYDGNPYIKNNCTNINECEGPNQDCLHECVDTEGNYTCNCLNGYSGDGKRNGTGCTRDQPVLIKIIVGASVSVLLLLICVTCLYFVLNKRKHMIRRKKFFKKNGGIMLEQRISDGGFHDKAKVFTIDELKKATNNYDVSTIIGKGGFGTVFKGVLSDKRVVAIKKSTLAINQTESQIEQFINEVVILSQINHRNIVKLIGCCLETEVPSLVYEFIPNGTLYDHIHVIDNLSPMTWDIRLRIAMETAEALSYLHSAISVPIIHRDVKSMNILLDYDYVTKLADFGASKLVPMDKKELATIVQGTLRYLDPEYMQTHQLTDKSDVYSFGVVVVELLTGKRAISFDRPEEERNLAMYFLSSLKQEKLFHILDENLQLTEVPYKIIQVLELIERCLNVKGDERPSMKEVAMELQRILVSMIHRDRDGGTMVAGECLTFVPSVYSEEASEIHRHEGF